MENWRGYIKEQDSVSQSPTTAAIVWNNPNFRPFDKKILSNLPKYGIPKFLKSIPQGHSGVILVSEDPKRNQVNCISVDFGAHEGFCSKEHKKKFLYSLKNKLGIFVGGRVKVMSFSIAGENIIDNLNQNISKIIQKWKKISRSSHTPQEFGVSYDVDINRAMSFVRSKKGCSDYTVIPELAGSDGDNCGSFSLKVVAHGLGKENEAEDIIGSMIGPDGMIQKMQDISWIDVSMSLDYS